MTITPKGVSEFMKSISRRREKSFHTENQLTTVRKNNQLINEYGYDGDGKRVWAKDYEGYLPDSPKVTTYIGNYYEVQVEGYRPTTEGDPAQPCSAPSCCNCFPSTGCE